MAFRLRRSTRRTRRTTRPSGSAPSPFARIGAKQDVRYTVCNVQANAAVAGEPGRHRVPPLALADRPARAARRTWCWTSTRPRGGFAGGEVALPVARRVARGRAGRRGEDLRLEGRPYLRAARAPPHVRQGPRGAAPDWPNGWCGRPELVTIAFKKADRGDRVFLDTARNAPGAHIVAPVFAAGPAGAPVSFPVPWDELRRVSPAGLHHPNVPGCWSEGDLWASSCRNPRRSPGRCRIRPGTRIRQVELARRRPSRTPPSTWTTHTPSGSFDVHEQRARPAHLDALRDRSTSLTV